MAARRTRPKLTSAQIDAKHIAAGMAMTTPVSAGDNAKELAEANAGKRGRPFKFAKSQLIHLGYLRAFTDNPYRET